MSEPNRKIRDALAIDEAELLRAMHEPPLSEQVLATFHGRNRWLVGAAFVIGIGGAAFAFVSALNFFQADNFQEMATWAGGFGVSVIATALIKIWYWMELNKNAVTREIKRVELQIARLADLLEKAK